MPAHLFSFAASPENHDLFSPNSLHDAWLTSWNVLETQEASTGARTVQIEAVFLGPRQDRLIHLTYNEVQNYEVTWPGISGGIAQIAHGDLLVHELQVVSRDVFVHELVFSTGAIFRVQFGDLTHRIELITPERSVPP
jgi:hypothetical protein